MQFQVASMLIALLLTQPIFSSPTDDEVYGYKLMCYAIDANSPTVADIITAENKLIASNTECYQGDTNGCQDHAIHNNAQIQVCGYPLWHQPCFSLARISEIIRKGCAKDGRAAGQWTLFKNAKVVVG
jgi:hypothetical protein